MSGSAVSHYDHVSGRCREAGRGCINDRYLGGRKADCDQVDHLSFAHLLLSSWSLLLTIYSQCVCLFCFLLTITLVRFTCYHRFILLPPTTCCCCQYSDGSVQQCPPFSFLTQATFCPSMWTCVYLPVCTSVYVWRYSRDDMVGHAYLPLCVYVLVCVPVCIFGDKVGMTW